MIDLVTKLKMQEYIRPTGRYKQNTRSFTGYDEYCFPDIYYAIANSKNVQKRIDKAERCPVNIVKILYSEELQ